MDKRENNPTDQPTSAAFPHASRTRRLISWLKSMEGGEAIGGLIGVGFCVLALIYEWNR